MTFADRLTRFAPDRPGTQLNEQVEFGVPEHFPLHGFLRARNLLKIRGESWHADRVKPTAIQRWRRLHWSKRALLAEATAAVCAASLAVRLLPFKWAIRLSTRPTGETSSSRPNDVLSEIQWSVDAATRHLPWTPVCIQRGLATQWMLRRRGIDARLHYGLTNDNESALKAHVWVEAFGKTVVGGEEAGDYVRVATFP